MFSVIIPYFNGHKTIQRLLDSLPANLPVIVVDDQSDSPFYSLDVSEREGLRVFRPLAKGYFTGAVNRGIEACNTDVLILNQDVYFTGKGWLDLLDEALDDYDLIGEGIQGSHPAWPMGYIHGTFMYISRRVIDTIGLLNEVDYPLWGSTCEYQLRACRAGFRALPLSTIPDFHHRDLKQKRFGDAINTALEREPARQREFIRTPPEISVIIPNYNYGRYLPDAIQGLIAQTFQSFEVVIVDDASTDNSLDIISGLVDPWKGIRAVGYKQNRGTAGALNFGIENSYGRYIAILSADDAMKPNRLENFYRLQLEHPHSFIYDDLVLFGSAAERLNGGKRDGEELILKLPPYDFNELLMKNGVHAGIFYPRQAWKDVGGYPATMGRGREDWAFNVALGLKGWCGVKCDNPGYLYRREGQNRTINNTDPVSRQKFLGQMLALYPDIYRGGRPMGCCGSGSSNSNGAKAAAPANGGGMMAMSLPGARDGMEILEYIGTSASDMTWYGPESKTRYVFGGNRKVGYVDKRDVAKMVALVDQGKPTFRIYQKPVEETPAVEMSEEANQVMQEFELSRALQGIDTKEPGEEFLIDEPAAVEIMMTAGAELVRVGRTTYTTSLPFSPADYSFRQLSKMVDELTADQLVALAEAEKAGKNRSSVIGLFTDKANG